MSHDREQGITVFLIGQVQESMQEGVRPVKIRMKRCKCRKKALYSWLAAPTFATLITIHEG